MCSPGKITVVESPTFRRWVRRERVRKQVDTLAEVLVADPRAGDVIPGAASLRKIRMPRPGKGKRGGYRVIYALLVESSYLALLAGYDKTDRSDLSADERNELVVIARLMDAELRASISDTEETVDE